MSEEFVDRLSTAFGNESVAKVAKRLKVPHATVRNYFQGRLPASDVLIKIARETGVSLSWLLLGVGEIYTDKRSTVNFDKLIEEKIDDLIERKLAALPAVAEMRRQENRVFDVEEAIKRFDDPQRVMNEWFQFEGRAYPSDYGVVFFRGWETFSHDDKLSAVRDAKRVLDRSLSNG